MTSVQFVVHPLPGTQEQLAEKLKSVADRLNKYGHQGENSLDARWSPSVVSYVSFSQVCLLCQASGKRSSRSQVRRQSKMDDLIELQCLQLVQVTLLFSSKMAVWLGFPFLSSQIDLI